MVDDTEKISELLELATELRCCLNRVDALGQAIAAIHIDHAINILELATSDNAMVPEPIR